MIYDIAPKLNEEKKRKLLRVSKRISVAFIIAIFLPFLTYLLFHFNLLKSKPLYDRDLLAPVALVTTSSGTGTAFLIGETKMLTARHVVKNLAIGETVELLFEKADPPVNTTATLVWKDPQTTGENEMLNDVAVLELTNPAALPEDFPRLFLGSSIDIVPRDKVILIGYPNGLMSTTSGTVSNDKVKNLDIFLLDAGAWPGNSGGPLLSENTNEVIGILIAGFTEEFQGMNLALKIDNVTTLLMKTKIKID